MSSYQYTNDIQLQLDLTEDPASEKAIAAANYIKEKAEKQEALNDKYTRSLQAGLINEAKQEKVDYDNFTFSKDESKKAKQDIEESNRYKDEKAGLVAQGIPGSNPGSNAGNVTALSPHAQEMADIRDNVISPEKYRNTGIWYFDTTRDLTIGDMFLAKYMGLDLRPVELNVNANVNANVKHANSGKIKGEMESLVSNARILNEGIEEYDNARLGSVFDRAVRWGLKIPYIGAFVGMGASDENIKQFARDERNPYNVAKGIGEGKMTNQDIKNARQMIDSTNTSQRGQYGKMAIANDLLLAKLSGQIQTAEELGIPVSQKNRLEAKALENIVKGYHDATNTGRLGKPLKNNLKALEKLRENSEESTLEAMRLIFGD